MITRAYSVAFQGIDARLVEVQCGLSPGLPGFSIVGLPDKSVSEARDRIRSALASMAVALPSKRITINLSPADLPKEGSHFDVPIALALLAALDVLPQDKVEASVSLGELSLDGSLIPVPGALPAALAAAEADKTLICPRPNGSEAIWVGAAHVLAPASLTDIISHFTGQISLASPTRGQLTTPPSHRDLQEIKGQERAKRALEIATAGRHHLLMVGAPGAGKSMLAKCIPGLLPPLSAQEALETSMVHSIAGLLDQGGICHARPFSEPHHTASTAAIVGGGRTAQPGQISLAHNGVLFMDELPEFSRSVLDTLRQPIENGEILIARAHAHVRYPCRFMLVAAANPCRCGHLSDPARACARVPQCGQDYLGKVSGPLLDRFDLRIEVPPVSISDLGLPSTGETSAHVAKRVAQAHAVQGKRFEEDPAVRQNADAHGALLEKIATPDREGQALLSRAADHYGLSARGYHRILRVARTIADLDHSDAVRRPHIAEALSFRITTMLS